MENRKRQLKSSRRIMNRRSVYNHGKSVSFKPQPLETTVIPNYPGNNNNNKQRSSATSASTSMRAFNFNLESLGRNKNFVALPKDPIDRRVAVKVQSENKTPLYKSPASLDLIMRSPYLLGGINGSLGLDKSVVGELTSNYFKFLKKISGKTAPSDRDVIFGNARMLLKQATGWENSRIQWLLDLEHRQDMRRARAQLCEDDCVDICCFPFSPHMLIWNTE